MYSRVTVNDEKDGTAVTIESTLDLVRFNWLLPRVANFLWQDGVKVMIQDIHTVGHGWLELYILSQQMLIQVCSCHQVSTVNSIQQQHWQMFTQRQRTTDFGSLRICFPLTEAKSQDLELFWLMKEFDFLMWTYWKQRLLLFILKLCECCWWVW